MPNINVLYYALVKFYKNYEFLQIIKAKGGKIIEVGEYNLCLCVNDITIKDSANLLKEIVPLQDNIKPENFYAYIESHKEIILENITTIHYSSINVDDILKSPTFIDLRKQYT